MLLRYISICCLTIIMAFIGLISACNSIYNIKNIKDNPKELAEAKKLLNKLNHEYAKWTNEKVIEDWNDSSDLNKIHTSVGLNEISRMKENNIHDSEYINNTYQEINKFPWHNIIDYDVRRQFKKFSNHFKSLLSHQKYPEHFHLISKMEKLYSTMKVCNVRVKNYCELVHAPDMWTFMRKTHNLKELKYIWKSWHDQIGKKVKKYFIKYVKYSNKIARMNNYKDMSAMWLSDYETDDFSEQINSLWHEIKPLYSQLHAYIRRKLREKYGAKIISKTGPIPAHLFGNIWAQSWIEIGHFTAPYPEKKFPDITNMMIKQNWNEKKIFKVAEDFFTSIKLNSMPKSFWHNSILKKSKNHEMVCHPAAYDFFDGKDFRIKQCTQIDMDNLLTAYHEMGHIEYYIQYKDQPAIYRDGANAGFHEAIGDTISLSAFTLNNFESIGLLNHTTTYDYETMINHLYIIALEKLAFIPFAYIMDKWRYDIFQLNILPENYNCHWWYLNEKYRGIISPVKRSKVSFDPAGKYHIIADIEYMRYFISHIVQFQFHKSLCIEAGQYDPMESDENPMSNCNIRRSKKAGKLLKSILRMGSSRPWPDVMEKITGQRNMDAGALKEYFMPLIKWLKMENEKYDEFIGWKRNHKHCVEKD